jgi:hypothetical protein
VPDVAVVQNGHAEHLGEALLELADGHALGALSVPDSITSRRRRSSSRPNEATADVCVGRKHPLRSGRVPMTDLLAGFG